MTGNITPARCAGLFAAVAVALALAAPDRAGADFIAVSVGALPPPREAVAESPEEPEELEDGGPAGWRIEDCALLMLWMIIGDVPVAPLTQGNTSSGGGPGTSPGWLPGDDTGGGGDTPAHTPEPASWLLGLIGSGALGLALMRSRLRLRTC